MPIFFIRLKINAEEISTAEVMRWYNTINAALLDHLTNQIKETDNSGVWRLVHYYRSTHSNLPRTFRKTLTVTFI